MAFGLAGLALIGLAFFSMRAQAFDFDDPPKTPTPNTIRRSATANEALSMISVYHNCYLKNGRQSCNKSAGFLIRNSQSRLLAMVARHTFKNSIERACNNPGYQIYFLEKHRGRCTQVVASSSHYDLAVIELSFGQRTEDVLEIAKPLRLTSEVLTTGSAVKAIGYPGDHIRRFQLTTSDDCWLGSDSFQPNELESKANLKWEFQQRLRSDLVLHNCQIYAGNSGGPLIDKSTGEVFAVTNFFNRKTQLTRSSLEFVPAETLKFFLQAHEQILNSFGVGFRKPEI